MQLDIDAILDVVQPWDFTVVVGGVTYATRRPAVGELAAFGEARDDPRRIAPVLSGLFVGEAVPDVAAWRTDQALAFMAGYTEYFRAVAERGKAPADVVATATAAVASAMAAPGLVDPGL